MKRSLTKFLDIFSGLDPEAKALVRIFWSLPLAWTRWESSVSETEVSAMNLLIRTGLVRICFIGRLKQTIPVHRVSDLLGYVASGYDYQKSRNAQEFMFHQAIIDTGFADEGDHVKGMSWQPEAEYVQFSAEGEAARDKSRGVRARQIAGTIREYDRCRLAGSSLFAINPFSVTGNSATPGQGTPAVQASASAVASVGDIAFSPQITIQNNIPPQPAPVVKVPVRVEPAVVDVTVPIFESSVGLTCQQKMVLLFHEHSEAREWSANQIGARIKEHPDTVRKTPTWQALQQAKAGSERTRTTPAQRRRGKPVADEDREDA